MRRPFAIALVLLAGCAGSHVTDRPDAGDSAATDGGVLGADSGATTGSLGDERLATCLCHHGCGPGIDGYVELTLTNADATDHVVLVTDVTLTPLATPGSPFVTSRDGWFLVGGASADGSLTVAAGTTVTSTLTIYFDMPTLSPPGDYRVEVSALVDGVEASFVLPIASVVMGPDCV